MFERNQIVTVPQENGIVFFAQVTKKNVVKKSNSHKKVVCIRWLEANKSLSSELGTQFQLGRTQSLSADAIAIHDAGMNELFLSRDLEQAAIEAGSKLVAEVCGTDRDIAEQQEEDGQNSDVSGLPGEASASDVWLILVTHVKAIPARNDVPSSIQKFIDHAHFGSVMTQLAANGLKTCLLMHTKNVCTSAWLHQTWETKHDQFDIPEGEEPAYLQALNTMINATGPISTKILLDSVQQAACSINIPLRKLILTERKQPSLADQRDEHCYPLAMVVCTNLRLQVRVTFARYTLKWHEWEPVNDPELRQKFTEQRSRKREERIDAIQAKLKEISSSSERESAANVTVDNETLISVVGIQGNFRVSIAELFLQAIISCAHNLRDALALLRKILNRNNVARLDKSSRYWMLQYCCSHPVATEPFHKLDLALHNDIGQNLNIPAASSADMNCICSVISDCINRPVNTTAMRIVAVIDNRYHGG